MSSNKRNIAEVVAATQQAVQAISGLPAAVRQRLLEQYMGTPASQKATQQLEALCENTELKATLERYTHLSEQQRKAVELAATRANVLITGPAGTGKSMLIAAIMDYMRRRFPGGVALMAYTGCAAVLINGSTVHSFFGLKPPLLSPERSCAGMSAATQARLKATEHIVIDEVSMMSPELFDVVNALCQKARRSKAPFGGISLTLCGDFYQLPAVAPDVAVPPLLFDSAAYVAAGFAKHTVTLSRIFRQSDSHFRNILNIIRQGPRTADEYVKACAFLESRRRSLTDDEKARYTVLYTRKAAVAQENTRRLAALQTETRVYTSVDWSEFPGYNFDNDFTATHELTLKVGARVLCLKNLDTAKGIVNGTAGTVLEVALGGPLVEFDNGEKLIMQPVAFEKHRGEKVIASRVQVPLALAWALTVHKAQGMTLRHVYFNISALFEHGLLYVGCSRATDPDGLVIEGRIAEKWPVDERVTQFYDKLVSCIPDSDA